MRDLADHFLGRRIDHRNGAAVGALGPGAVDHQGDIAVGHVFPPYSASAIGRIAPGRAEQRDVIMPLRLGDGKAQRHDIEEGRIAAVDTPAAKMVAHGEAQFVAPDRQADGRRSSGWSVRPSAFVISRSNIMAHFRRRARAGSTATPTAGRPAWRVEHVGAEPAVHARHALARHLRRDAQPRDVEDFLQGGSEFGRGIVAPAGARTAPGSDRACDGARRSMKGKPNFAL